MQKSENIITDGSNSSNILVQKFGAQKRWLNWKLETREGKLTKVPYQTNGELASSTNPFTWSTYKWVKNSSDNVGIVLLPDKKLVCIDIDHIIKDGKIEHELKEKIADFILETDSYCELSQSGTGLHIFLEITDSLPIVANKHEPFEVYTSGRYIAVTENCYGKPKEVRTVTPKEALRLLAIIGYPWGKQKQTPNQIVTTNQTAKLDDSVILEKMFSARNGDRIKSLYNGDISQYKDDDSSADMALCTSLSFWTSKNAQQIERIWLNSPLGARQKTQERKDYRERTISNAIAKCKEQYVAKISGPKKDKKEDKPVFKTSIITADEIYEMVFDSVSNKTSFFKMSKSGEIEPFLDSVEIHDVEYFPLSPNYNLVEKRVILFPSQATAYKDEAEILEEIHSFIHKYLEISEVYEHIATYYVLFTWLYDKFNELPYLRTIGDFGSGKSRFLQAIGILCYKPVFIGGATTPSPIFRIINEVHGTLIIDEADFKFSDMTSEVVKILNTGYQKGIPVLRSEGKGTFEVKAYDVFCPKIVATRETFSDKALESRFLVEEMGVGRLRSDIPRTLNENFYQEAELIRNKLLMWRLKNYFEPIERREEIIEGIHPRLNQIVIPLLSVIKDEPIRAKLKSFIIKYNIELVADRGLSHESDIMLAILRCEYEKGLNEMTMSDIAGYVNEDITEFEDNLTPKKIGWYLRARMQLKPYKTRKGFVLNVEKNRKKLDFWKERYGIEEVDIKDASLDGEHVNIVNATEPTETSKIPFSKS